MILSREDAEEFLAETVQRLAQNGWHVTGGPIILLDLRVCPKCGTETIYVPPEHECPACSAAVRLLGHKVHAGLDVAKTDTLVVLEESNHLTPEQLEQLRPVVQSDAPFCPKCQSQMLPHGACYTCHNCGEGSSCG